MPEQRPTDTRLALKVDVDTLVGLQVGVPRLLDLSGRLGLKASFYVSLGPDHSGRALKRAFKPGFLSKQMRSGAAGAYGLKTMLYGLALPGPVIATRAPGALNRIIDQGHEAGLHAWDHVYWQDRLAAMPADRMRRELAQGAAAFREVTGMAPASFAAPGWQVTPPAMAAMAEMGMTHVSCTRGAEPFRPVVEGRALALVELPTTLPSLDEVLGLGTPADRAAAHLAGLVIPGRLNVFTLHAEVEGRRQAPILEELCRRLMEQGVRFLRLVDAAAEEAASAPARELDWVRVPGRAYAVAAAGKRPAA